VVALGKIGFDAYLNYLKRNDILRSKAGYTFAHAARYFLPNGITLLASYHPSNQNTATGKLNATMFEAVFRKAKKMAFSGS
jgi:uracil-DNA glycosylase